MKPEALLDAAKAAQRQINHHLDGTVEILHGVRGVFITKDGVVFNRRHQPKYRQPLALADAFEILDLTPPLAPKPRDEEKTPETPSGPWRTKTAAVDARPVGMSRAEARRVAKKTDAGWVFPKRKTKS